MLLYLHLIRIFKFFMASALKHIINEILYRLTSLEFCFNIIPGIAFNVSNYLLFRKQKTSSHFLKTMMELL